MIFQSESQRRKTLIKKKRHCKDSIPQKAVLERAGQGSVSCQFVDVSRVVPADGAQTHLSLTQPLPLISHPGGHIPFPVSCLVIWV